MSKQPNKPLRVVFIGDTHCGHRVGLLPPAFHVEYGSTDPKFDNDRVKLWDYFADEIKALGPIDVLMANGDMIDGKGEKSGGTELLTTDRHKQVDMAAEVVRFINAKKVYMTYGTGYHTGNEEDWETVLQRECKAVKIESHGHYDINGTIFNVRHHIGNTSTPMGKFTALARADVTNLLWSELGQQPRANVIIRSHIHRFCYCGDERRMMMTLPALQGLGSKYGSRRCDGLPVHFGFVHFDVAADGTYTWQPHIAELAMQAAKVIKV